MKTLLLTIALSVFASNAFSAEDNTFAACHGDHHGTYVDFKTDAKGTVYIETSNDGDDAPVKYKITKVSKYDAKLEAKAYSWAIRQAIKSMNADSAYGMIFVKATTGKSNLLLNLNKHTGESFVVVDDYVEKLECPLSLIKE